MAAAQEIGWALKALHPQSVPLERVLSVVRTAFLVTQDELLAKRRNDRTVVWARKVAMYVARRKCGLSYPYLGRYFDRDHTTVMAAERRVFSRILKDESFAAVVNRLMLEVEAQ
jgi:chromosomal replication initiator protein